MEIKVVAIEDQFYGPNEGKGELAIEPAPHHKRVVRSVAKCPWHEEKTASLLADHCKGTFHCLSCGAEGYLVTDPTGPMAKEGCLTLQREDA